MCLTLLNAAAVLEYQNGWPRSWGFTRTRHHIGHLSPGDLWCPDPDGAPHTLTSVSRRNGRIELVDQYGVAFRYLAGSIINTAVPDPRVCTGSPQPAPKQGAAAA
jgi:hypothetical protein